MSYDTNQNSKSILKFCLPGMLRKIGTKIKTRLINNEQILIIFIF